MEDHARDNTYHQEDLPDKGLEHPVTGNEFSEIVANAGMEDHNNPTEDYDDQGSDCVKEGGTADALSGIGNNQGADHAGFGGAPEGLRDLPGLPSNVPVGVPHQPPTISHDKIQCPAQPNLKDCDYQDMEQVGGDSTRPLGVLPGLDPTNVEHTGTTDKKLSAITASLTSPNAEELMNTSIRSSTTSHSYHGVEPVWMDSASTAGGLPGDGRMGTDKDRMDDHSYQGP